MGLGKGGAISIAELNELLGAQAPDQSISWLNMMVYGEPGVGKTYFIGTAADHKITSPVLIFDIDGGVSTLRKKSGVHVVQIRSIAQLVKNYKMLFNAIPSNGKRFPYGTIAIDSWSELQALHLAQIARSFASTNDKLDPDIPDMRAYAKSLNVMREVLRMFRDLPCNLIISCHSETDRDENMKLIHKIKLTGKLRIDIPGFLDVVGYYRAEKDDDGVNRYMQFQGTSGVTAKDRTGAFEAVELNPTVPILWDKLQSSNTGEK